MKILHEYTTRKRGDTITYYQSPMDIKTGFYKKTSNDSCGSDFIKNLSADIANEIIGRYFFNEVKNLIHTVGDPLVSELHYFIDHYGKPYFISKNDHRINHTSVKHIIMEINLKNLLTLK